MVRAGEGRENEAQAKRVVSACPKEGGGGVNRGAQIRRSVANSLSDPSIRDYFCSNPYTKNKKSKVVHLYSAFSI